MVGNVLCLFLMVQWVGLQCVIAVFPGHTHLLFYELELGYVCREAFDQLLCLF